MKALLRRITNVANDRVTRVLFYDQTLKKGYASLASFSNLFVLRRILMTLVAYPLSLMCWVILVILNIFMPVRTYRFKSPSRPGFASVYIEQLEPLCRELQDSGNKGFLMFIDASQTTNLELLKLYATHFNFYLDDRVAFIRTIFTLIPRIGFSNTFLKHSHYNPNWELPPAKNLKIEKKILIPEIIAELGLRPSNYVVISYPSINYYLQRTPNIANESNRFIDPTISIDALDLLIKREIKVVIVGIDTGPLPTAFEVLPIIDLSGRNRTDEHDLWLFENCLFLWSMGGVGTWHFAHKFGRPSLVTDSYKLHHGNQATLFSLQLVRDKKSNRMLTLSEIFSSKGVLGKTQKMDSCGLLFIQNTSEELCAAVEEILAFATSSEQYSSYEMVLLEKYDQIRHDLGGIKRENFHSRPCKWLLKDHHEVLF